jgi:Zn-dependent protease with chaperone function
MIQRNLEGKIHEKGKKPETSYYWQALRTFFWSLIAGFSYVSSVMASVFVFTAIGVLAGAPMPVRMGLMLFGMAVGVVAGLCLSFSLGALFVRKIICAQDMPEGELRHLVLDCFKSAGIEAPALWLVDGPQFHFGSAMMAGFPKGRGIFRPGFFISSNLSSALSAEELRAVVLHEISHWRMQHLKKRFVYSSGLILCASLMTGMTVLCCRLAGISEQGQSVVGFGSLLISFLFAFRLLAQQVKYQEFAADIHSIERLGSSLADLSSALRKLDRIQDPLAARRDPGSMLMSLGHPATEYRIRILERYFEKKAAMAQAAAQTQGKTDSDKDDTDSKVA